MRAGPLSNAKVVTLLNTYFVPVYVSNEDYRKDGAATSDEKAEYQRLYREALQAKLSTGTVHAYILAPDGFHPIDSLHVANAAKVENLVEMLERTIAKLQLKAGDPVVKPIGQAQAPKCDEGALALHLTSRYLRQKGNELVPLGAEANLGQTRNASWSAYASENWVVLTRDEVGKLLQVGNVKVGQSWELDIEVMAKLLNHFYPSTENNDLAKNRIDDQSARATILTMRNGVARARVDGRLRMKHPFYHKADDNFVSATFVGFVDFAPGSRIISLKIVTERATYGSASNGRPFGVAVDASA